MMDDMEGSTQPGTDLDTASSSPEPVSVSTEYTDLVESRLAYYDSVPWDTDSVPDPRITPEERVTLSRRARVLRRVFSLPCRMVMGGVTAAATFPVLDGWSVTAAALVGVAAQIAEPRVAAAQPALDTDLRADLHQALQDFTAAEPALHAAQSDPKALMSVTWFEPRVREALLTLTDPAGPHADAEKVWRAEDDLYNIAARAWAVTALETRRAQVAETALTPVVEALEEVVEALEEVVEDRPDFSEIDAVASSIATETVEFARDMDVALPALISPRSTLTTHDADGNLLPVGGAASCSHCGACNVTFRGDTALCGACANYWTVPSAADGACSYKGGCACSSCEADDAMYASECQPCDEPAPAHSDFDPAKPYCGACGGSGDSSDHGSGGICQRCSGTGRNPNTDRKVTATADHTSYDGEFEPEW